MDCTCTIRNHGRVIEFCPMHKAAPEMLAALDKLAEDVRTYPYDPLGSLDHIEEIIAQARGQEAK